MIVDEAGIADTPKLAQLARLADQHHWRVVLVGDPRQFAAVGRGGMVAHLVDKFGRSNSIRSTDSNTGGNDRPVSFSAAETQVF